MEMRENVTAGVGRGRGSATKVPERALIEQIRERPLLYDKTAKDYRKPGISDAAWNDVAAALGTSVTNCRKRWKSLRDTFIKYYRLEVLYSTGESKRKQKTWTFYRDLDFLKSHIELFRTEEGIIKEGHGLFYVKEIKGSDDDSHFKVVETNEGSKEVYEIKIADEEYEEGDTYNVKEDHLLETFDDQVEYDILEQTDEKTYENPDESEFYETENEAEEQEIVTEETEASPSTLELPIVAESQKKESSTEDNSIVTKNIIDPDERYLMSCLPAFKRFTPQQKAYVRMGIEKLFYEVEFENVSEPRSKRNRMS